MQAKAIIFSAKNEVNISSFEQRKPQKGEVLIQTEYSCISPGTELRCLRGGEKNAGDFPFIPGYSLTGTIIATGDDVELRTGTKVFASGTIDAGKLGISWGGHVSHAICEADNVVPVPEGVSMRDASMTALAAIAFHGMRLSLPDEGEKVVVIGLGVIGQFSARLHALNGVDLIACDISKNRVQTAIEAGIEAIVIDKNFDNPALADADIVIDSTGVPAVARQAMELIKDIPWDNSLTPGGRFVVQGSYEQNVEIPYNTAFNKEISVLFPRSKQKRDQIAVLDLMKEKSLDVENLISEVISSEKAPECYKALQEPGNTKLTYIFKW